MKRIAAMIAGCLLGPASAQAGVYWNHSVRSSSVSVCFVGDAVTSRPDRVNEVLQDLKEYEYAGNVHFNYLGACPAPTIQRNGDDYFEGDIRIVLRYTDTPGTGIPPGNGCPEFQDANGNYNGKNNGWGSWSNGPDELETFRSCMFNLKLGDDSLDGTDPYLNHTLHEVGHGLGLGHEHERADVDMECTESGYGGSRTAYVTGYDPDSVMHYQFLSCGINGNYDYTGLSDMDRLMVHVLYPEAVRTAELVGTTIIRTGETMHLKSAWADRGGYEGKVVSSYAWELNGLVYGTGPFYDQAFAYPGSFALSLEYTDFLGRLYTYNGTVKVLTPDDFAATVSGPIAALL